MISIITMERMAQWGVEFIRTIRANFSDDNCDKVVRLLDHCPSGQCFTTQLGAAAYRKGLLAGLSIDSLKPDPINPYRARTSNFARSANNPHVAWNSGLRDGSRIKDMLHRPDRIPTLVPAILWREAKIIGYQQQKAGAR